MSHPLLARLQDRDPAVRVAACREVADDPAAVLLLDGLGRALCDPVRAVARAASDALAVLAPRHPEVDDLLRRLLRGDDPRGRWGAAYTRARLGPPDAGLLPATVEALGSGDPDTRWAAARLLVDLARQRGEALHVALGLARGADAAVVRRMAVFCLRELAGQDEAVAPALLEATGDSDREVRRAALSSLVALRDAPPAVTERLVAILRDDADAAARRLAALALGELASRGTAETPLVRALLEQSAHGARDPGLRQAAARALARGFGSTRDQNTSASSE